jgi:hypothetical protein
MPTTKVYIHDGAYDCSELVRMAYRAADVLPYGCHMWTGNEVELLTSHGFVERSLSSPQRGDVLWREGHTEMYLGDGMQGGARIDESGTIYGNQGGDQTGREITCSAYDPVAWKWEKLLRYEGGKTINGIPAAIVAAGVVDHVIDHDAEHGYSQPRRAGDGGLEEVTITYDPDTTEAIPMRKTVTFKRATSVRTRPSADDDAKTGTVYKVGEPCNIDGIVFADNRVWGTYVGSKSGERRYVCLGTTERAEVA